MPIVHAWWGLLTCSSSPFTAEANTRTKGGFSSMSLPCSLLSKSLQFLPYIQMKDMDFKTPSLQ